MKFGCQIMDEEDQLRFGFDLLDPTKFVPEELVPITPLGKMTLNLNPKNFFAETEQIMVSLKFPLRASARRVRLTRS
jgi:catalase